MDGKIIPIQVWINLCAEIHSHASQSSKCQVLTCSDSILVGDHDGSVPNQRIFYAFADVQLRMDVAPNVSQHTTTAEEWANELLSATGPPAFGEESRKLFLTDPSFINLNHGSFGGVPAAIEEACQALSRNIEGNFDAFMRHQYFNRIDSARTAIARFIGAEVDTCVFVPNVATGIGTVLKNFEWKFGDVLVYSAYIVTVFRGHGVEFLSCIADLVFTTIASAIHDLHHNWPALQISEFIMDLPISHKYILKSFRKHLQQLKEESGVPRPPSSKIVVLFESISSTPAIVLPWKDMVRICREEGVWSIVDAAHSLGQEAGLQLSTVDPDFWVANCSKWLYAKRSSAILYVPFRNQEMIKQPVLPAFKFPSPGVHPSDFVWQFYWSGMADPVPTLSIEYALAFRNRIGGEEKINTYCHSLAMIGGRRIAAILGTSVLDSSEKEGEIIGNMINIELPLPPTTPSSVELHFKFQEEMFENYKTFAILFSYKGRWWVRASAQIYNQLSDFEYLGDALKVVCQKLREI